MENHTISEAMLMTAGFGTRLQPFSKSTPKPLLPVVGVPVVQYLFDSLSNCGVTKAVANVHHLAEQTRSGLLNLEFSGSIRISDESEELLGSAGGIRHALHQFDSESFFYANGDVLCDVDWRALASCHFRLRSMRGVQVTLAVFPTSPPGEKYREVLFDPHTQLITGLGQVRSECPFFIGAAVLEKGACSGIPLSGQAGFVSTILEPSIRRKKAGVFLSSGSWYDLGSPSLWFHTHRALIDRLEIGQFSSRASRLWKKRIERVNLRINEKMWISKGSPRPVSSAQWAPACYWDGRLAKNSRVPVHFGPSAFLYGEEWESMPDLRFGIGLKQNWYSDPGAKG